MIREGKSPSSLIRIRNHCLNNASVGVPNKEVNRRFKTHFQSTNHFQQGL